MADRISVVVPVYNVAKDLPRCLDSILAQTYPDIEILAVNDGSLDNSGNILEQYATKYANIRVIHKENGGVTSARLRGVQEATGEWIGFVDGDDEIEPDMYGRLLNNALTHNAQISHCGYQMHFADGRIHHFYNTGLFAKLDKTAAIRELLSGVMIEPGLCNKLFHKTLLHSLLHSGKMDAGIRINEDLLMNYYLFKTAESSVFEDWCPYHYIVRSSSASRTAINEHKIYDPIRVKEIILEDTEDVLKDDARRAYVNTCINTYHLLLFVGATYREDLRKVRNKVIQEKKFFFLLEKKRWLMAHLIVHAPLIYKPIYGIYCRYFQNNVYS